jgi:hypothetical protein
MYHAEKISGIPMAIIDLIARGAVRCDQLGEWKFRCTPRSTRRTVSADSLVDTTPARAGAPSAS